MDRNACRSGVARRGWFSRRYVVATLALLLLGAQPHPVRAAEKSTSPTSDVVIPPVRSAALRTPQVDNALQPLKHVAVEGAVVHAAVAATPDPYETRLGRSFDMTLAAAIAGFQAHGYVLDGFAFEWTPRPGAKGGDDGAKDGGDAPTPMPSTNHRDVPSLLVFRKDLWRRRAPAGTTDAPPSQATPDASETQFEYFLLFLVGESPTYGIQPVAFAKAARCALLLDGLKAGAYDPEADCSSAARDAPANDKDKAKPSAKDSGKDDRKPGDRKTLTIIGPSFSGSMASIVQSLRNDVCRTPGDCALIDVLLLSPSATGQTNGQVEDMAIPRACVDGESPGKCTLRIEYVPVAIPLGKQFSNLATALDVCGDGPRRIVVLAEESTFGSEILSAAGEMRCKDQPASINLVTAQFPPNIASIRTEQARLKRPQKEQWRALMPGADRLLEFNLDEADDGIDRPPPFQPKVSSRSDELMLYRLFDALRIYTRPQVVVIAATEVRDRLFLLSEVRNQLPGALPVMMELDYLAIHPDYRKTSRGAVVVPGGDSLACLTTEAAPGAEAKPGLEPRLTGCYDLPPVAKRYYPFPSDYAANTFRAVALLTESLPTDKTLAERARIVREETKPGVMVATLAGMQGLDVPVNSMAASELRGQAQLPSYVTMFGIAIFAALMCAWTAWDRPGGKWVLSFGRHLIYDFIAVREDVGSSLVACGQLLRGHPLTRHPDSSDRGWLKPKWNAAWLTALAMLAAAAVVIAAVRGWQILSMYPDCRDYTCQDFRLAHGRDVYAMACILLLYGCVFVVATARGLVLERRMHLYIRNLAALSARPQYRQWWGAKGAWIVPVLGFVVLTLTLYAGRPQPTSVDASFPWWFAILVLGLGLAHIIELIRQHRLQRRFSAFLSNAGPPIRRMRADEGWPNHMTTNEPPTTPFNLKVRRTLDLVALRNVSPPEWAEQTQGIIDSALTFHTNASFHAWERRLVAELKLIAVVVRTTAWSAMLAPIAVLLSLVVYPPVFEGFFTTAAILLLVTAFGVVIVIVLRMESDTIFGAIFTRDGDTLTIGGGFRALWPKFVAMGLVLLPIVAPDIWRWAHGLIRSVNSIQ